MLWTAIRWVGAASRRSARLQPSNAQRRYLSRGRIARLELRLKQLQDERDTACLAPAPAAGAPSPHAWPDLCQPLKHFRLHNTSLPSLQGQPIKGQIIRADRHSVTVDTGFKTTAKFYKSSLQLSQLVASADKSVRESRHDFRIGDSLHFVITEVETPYGEVWLDVDRPSTDRKFQQVWAELQQLQREGRKVLGRVLNPVNGGYSVGVGGLVAFCPLSQCSVLTASKVGVLQPFIIHQMKEANHNVVVVDPKMMELSSVGAVA